MKKISLLSQFYRQGDQGWGPAVFLVGHTAVGVGTRDRTTAASFQSLNRSPCWSPCLAQYASWQSPLPHPLPTLFCAHLCAKHVELNSSSGTATLETCLEVSYEVKCIPPFRSSVSLLCICPREVKTEVHTKTCIKPLVATVFYKLNIQPTV